MGTTLLLSTLLAFGNWGMAEAQKTPQKLILFLGDSLTAGYGVKKEESYPEVLREDWVKQGRAIQIINGAESGSLSSSLVERLNFYLKRFDPFMVIIASGGNDARQLTPIPVIEKSLTDAVQLAKAKAKVVVLVQMRIFPNLGKNYAEQFAAIYPKVAKAEKVNLLPFFLEGIAGRPELNQADGFHPNANGHKKISEFLKPRLEKWL